MSSRNPLKHNEKYKCFKYASMYTVGDEKQFEQKVSEFLNPIPTPILNTFRYIFYKFKKGIFVYIKDYQLHFIPFSNVMYENEWSDIIDVPRNFHKKYKNVGPRHKWYANNGIFRYDRYIKEYMNGVDALYDMFQELCDSKRVRNGHCFINKRDHPLSTKDSTEPYNYIYNDCTPLLSHHYNEYAPILSMCSGGRFRDIPIPTWNDWANVSDKSFKKCRKTTVVYVPFTDKEYSTAVFRGSSTGFDVTLENPRLKLAAMSETGRSNKNGTPYLDVGITYWNTRPRICKYTKRIVNISKDIMNSIPLKDELTLEEQAEYKYIINVDGHVSSYRLTSELGTGSVLLLVDSDYKLWIHAFLEPWKHYVPVSRDFSDLYERLDWCEEHPKECEEMSLNAKRIYDMYICKQGILNCISSQFEK